MPKRVRMNQSGRRRGYVLLMTLLLLIVVAGTMAAACRSSLRHALDARESEQELQRRWAAISCEQNLLPNCELILVSHQSPPGRFAVSYRTELELSGQSIQLMFGDESAKINAPSLVRQYGKSDAAIRLRQLFSGSGMTEKIHLRPANFLSEAAKGGANRNAAELASFGAILDDPDPAVLMAAAYGLPCPADLVTCWGSGEVNWQRASEKTLRITLSPPLSLTQIQKLVALRSRSTRLAPVSLNNALDACGLTSPQRALANQRLCETSNCHSLWVNVKASNHAHYYHYVSVADRSASSISAFEW